MDTSTGKNALIDGVQRRFSCPCAEPYMGMLEMTATTRNVTFVSKETADAGTCYDCHMYYRTSTSMLCGSAKALAPFCIRHSLQTDNGIVMEACSTPGTVIISVARYAEVGSGVQPQ